MFEGFVHPGLAFGAALAAVPLLIHLLNRQRHRPMEWAAMRFVLAAYKRTRRRAQIENLILLLLRMAAVALLALAIARPFIGKDSPLAPLTESRQELVLVLDGSASTGYREGVASVRERIVEDRNRFFGGGVASGIDFALDLAARIRNEDFARFIQLSIEYDPHPPFDAGSPDKVPPEILERYYKMVENAAPDREAKVRAIAQSLGF